MILFKFVVHQIDMYVFQFGLVSQRTYTASRSFHIVQKPIMSINSIDFFLTHFIFCLLGFLPNPFFLHFYNAVLPSVLGEPLHVFFACQSLPNTSPELSSTIREAALPTLMIWCFANAPASQFFWLKENHHFHFLMKFLAFVVSESSLKNVLGSKHLKSNKKNMTYFSKLHSCNLNNWAGNIR